MVPAKNWTLALLFLALALPLAAMRPLWLDEILQLMDTRQPTVGQLMARLPYDNPGGAPLGYLVQQAALRILGYSVWSARLPAVLFGSASIFLTSLVAVELGLRRGQRSAILLALFPLMLRYGTEARMYSQALFFSVLATWIWLRLVRKHVRNPPWMPVAYWASLVVCAYTQPYAVSVGIAQVLWTVIYWNRRAAFVSGAALALAVGSFLPWYVHSKAIWAADLAGTPGFSASPKMPLMIFREFSGAGYWGTALLAVLCAMAVAQRSLPAPTVTLLALLMVTPVAGALCGDAYFGYFLANRQFLWALPAAAILAAAARGSRATHAATALLAVVCVWQSTRFFRSPHEDWQIAADTLADRVRQGDCITVAPPEQAKIYQFFHPGLESAGCKGDPNVLAVTPYATLAQRQAAIDAFQSAGCHRQRTTHVGGTLIVDRPSCLP
jgi:4-amino-4-deoxy-L-arabinose transferase-like glycosyltransferase